MEELPKDLKVLLAKKLPTKDIVALCRTSKNLREICKDPRYNYFWVGKIFEDFNLEYKSDNAFEEYKFLSELSRTMIYVIVHNPKDSCDTYTFYTQEAAKNFILDFSMRSEIIKNESNQRLKEHLEQSGELEDFLRVNGLYYFDAPDLEKLRSRTSEIIDEELDPENFMGIYDDGLNTFDVQQSYISW